MLNQWISVMSRAPITKHEKTAAYFISSFEFASDGVLPWNGSALIRHFAYLRCSMVWSFSFEFCYRLNDFMYLNVIPRYSGKFLSSKFITAPATLWNPITFSSMLIWEFARCWVDKLVLLKCCMKKFFSCCLLLLRLSRSTQLYAGYRAEQLLAVLILQKIAAGVQIWKRCARKAGDVQANLPGDKMDKKHYFWIILLLKQQLKMQNRPLPSEEGPCAVCSLSCRRCPWVPWADKLFGFCFIHYTVLQASKNVQKPNEGKKRFARKVSLQETEGRFLDLTARP